MSDALNEAFAAMVALDDEAFNDCGQALIDLLDVWLEAGKIREQAETATVH